MIRGIGFASDSPLEGTGFELSVPGPRLNLVAPSRSVACGGIGGAGIIEPELQAAETGRVTI